MLEQINYNAKNLESLGVTELYTYIIAPMRGGSMPVYPAPKYLVPLRTPSSIAPVRNNSEDITAIMGRILADLGKKEKDKNRER